jgi:hypothetical protein
LCVAALGCRAGRFTRGGPTPECSRVTKELAEAGSGVSVRRGVQQGEADQDLPELHHLSGDELGDCQSDHLHGAVNLGDDASDLLLVSPSGSAPRPRTISLLSMVSTSKWIATREQPVRASQSMSGLLDSRRSAGLKAFRPHSAKFG